MVACLSGVEGLGVVPGEHRARVGERVPHDRDVTEAGPDQSVDRPDGESGLRVVVVGSLFDAECFEYSTCTDFANSTGGGEDEIGVCHPGVCHVGQ